ncbi:MAG: hypothetical protein KAJ43_13725 [Gemmatimonadetes bacterium]|nr:hypothetical protein [Gemmatimonadota bacterium]
MQKTSHVGRTHARLELRGACISRPPYRSPPMRNPSSIAPRAWGHVGVLARNLLFGCSNRFQVVGYDVDAGHPGLRDP